MSRTLDVRSLFNPRAFFSSLFATSLLTLSCGPQLLLAQTGKASVSGRVTDQNNAALPNAQVQIRNTETKTVTSVKTNGEGLYVISSLNPGNYIMNVNKQGFRPVSVTGVTLNVQQNLSRNFVLRRDHHLRSGHRNSQNAELPLNKRSFSQRLTVTSGVTPINTSPNQGVNDLDNLGVSTASVAQPAIQASGIVRTCIDSMKC